MFDLPKYSATLNTIPITTWTNNWGTTEWMQVISYPIGTKLQVEHTVYPKWWQFWRKPETKIETMTVVDSYASRNKV